MESDVTLAKASGGFVAGFNVRANAQARELAKRDGVEIRYYSIIYNILDDVKAMLSGMLSPTVRENFLGNAEIRQIFVVTKSGKVKRLLIRPTTRNHLVLTEKSDPTVEVRMRRVASIDPVADK